MENASFSSGIFAGEHESVSFGRHFRDRSPEISEVVQSVGTPPEMMYRSSDTDSATLKSTSTVSKSTSLNSNQLNSSDSLSYTTAQGISVFGWPENENTNLIGDIKNWAMYRNTDRLINFTELIEDKTVYDQSQTLRPYLFVKGKQNQSESRYWSAINELPFVDTLNDFGGETLINRPCSTMVSTSKQNVDRSVHSSTIKPASSGNFLKVPGRTALGDISSTVQNTTMRSATDLPASEKWVTNLKVTKLNSVDGVHKRSIREQSMKIAAVTPSKIPIALHRQKSPIPNRSKQLVINGNKLPLPVSVKSNAAWNHFLEKFPLKANTSTVVWECTPLGNSVTKTFSLKNVSELVLRLKIEIIGTGFRMPVNAVDLKSNERRDIEVIFCPAKVGKARGQITIKPATNYWEIGTERILHLCAYGGSSNLLVQGIQHATVPSLLLKADQTDNVERGLKIFKASFSIYNKEPVSGSTIIFTKPRTKVLAMKVSQIFIEPRKLVIDQNEIKHVTITCQLQPYELELFRSVSGEVITIGSIMMIFGSEPDRQRIANILTKTNDPAARKEYAFLINGFPVKNIERFDDFRDRIYHVNDLFHGSFKVGEIALNIHRASLNETLDSTIYVEDMDIEEVEPTWILKPL